MNALRRLVNRILRRNRYRPREWCGVCGEQITKGWAVHEVMSSTGDPMEAWGGTVMSAFWCRKHKPDDERVVRWPS